MLRRVVITMCTLCLMGGIAYAADDQAAPDEGGDDACSQALAQTEESVRDKLEANQLSDADTDKVNELLDQADGQCSDGNMAGATQTLAQVKGIVAKAK